MAKKVAFYEISGVNLIRLRERARLSQQELGELLGHKTDGAQQWVSQRENQIQTLYLYEAEKIDKIFAKIPI